MIFWEVSPEQESESGLLQALLPPMASLHLCEVSLSMSLMYRRKQVRLPGLGVKDGKGRLSPLGIMERFTKGPVQPTRVPTSAARATPVATKCLLCRALPGNTEIQKVH